MGELVVFGAEVCFGLYALAINQQIENHFSSIGSSGPKSPLSSSTVPINACSFRSLFRPQCLSHLINSGKVVPLDASFRLILDRGALQSEQTTK